MDLESIVLGQDEALPAVNKPSGIAVLSEGLGSAQTLSDRDVGEPEWRERWVCMPLLVNGDRRHRTIVDTEGGKPSETQIHLLEGFGTYALVKAILHSGRTHQIRAHLAAISFSLIADGQYGDASHSWRKLL